VHDPNIDGEKKVFLGGTVETRNAVDVSGTWRWRRFVEFNGSLGYLEVENWKSEKGKSLSSPTLSGELVLRY
jgi:hypothetical protein